MEEISPARRSRQLVVVGVVAAIAVAGALFGVRMLSRVPINRLTPAGTPLVRLAVEVVDVDGDAVLPENSRIGSVVPVGAQALATATTTPQVTATINWSAGKPTVAPTPLSEMSASLKIVKRPAALTLSVGDGAKLTEWLEGNARAKEFISSELVQGAFSEVLETLKVRAEDLHLNGLESNIMQALLTDVLHAGAQLHYDIAAGRTGFVLTFDRARSTLASRALPLITNALARREYSIERIPESIVELLIGRQSLYLLEHDGVVYAANSLAALLTRLETADLISPQSRTDVAAGLELTVRGEAFINSLLPIMVGQSSWHARIPIDLSAQGLAIRSINLDQAKMFSYLKGGITPELAGAVPHDAFAALLTSFWIAPDMTLQQWQDLALKGPQEPPAAKPERAGVAIVWDLSRETTGLSSIGVAIAQPADAAAKEPPKELGIDGYFDVSTDTCAGGTVWLASNSDVLLGRMKEGCDRQSSSLLNSLEKVGRAKSDDQLIFVANPRAGLLELLEVGIGDAGSALDSEDSLSPAWKAQYVKAVGIARERAASSVSVLPQLLFAGRASASGAELKPIELKE